MAIKKAFWTPKAEESFDLIIEFIEYKWTDKEVKNFVTKVVKKRDALPFKVPKNISLVIVDAETGLHPTENTKNVIYESFKADKMLAQESVINNIPTCVSMASSTTLERMYEYSEGHSKYTGSSGRK